MDPYQVPESELVRPSKQPPKSLALIYSLLATAFIFTVIDYIVVIDMDGGVIFDSGNSLSIMLWLGILVLVGSNISKGKNNPKWLMLFLTAMVVGMSAIYYQGFPLVIINIAESVCYLAVFALLRKPEYSEWFNNKNT